MTIEPGAFFLLFFVFLVLLGIGAWFAYKAAEQRRTELFALAESLGWRFVPGEDSTHDERYADFAVFRQGHSRAAYNTIVGTLRVGDDGYALRAGDYTYKVTRHTGKSSSTTTYRFSYVVVHLPWNSAPSLLVRPEHVFDKIAGAFGFDDIDFESEAFSRRFHVKSKDRRFAYALLHPRMMEFLLERLKKGVELQHGRLLFTDGSRRASAQEFREAFTFLADFVALWPEHLVKDLERGQEAGV